MIIGMINRSIVSSTVNNGIAGINRSMIKTSLANIIVNGRIDRCTVKNSVSSSDIVRSGVDGSTIERILAGSIVRNGVNGSAIKNSITSGSIVRNRANRSAVKNSIASGSVI